LKYKTALAPILCGLMLSLSPAAPGQSPSDSGSSPSEVAESRSGKIQNQSTDFSKVVVPITSLRIFPGVKIGLNARPAPKLTESVSFGTGFCLDPVCRLIVTNYHVARLGTPRRIRGQRVINRYLATGPQDRDATIRFERDGDAAPYAMKRDLALYELRRPIPKHHGLKYSLDELVPGQEVEIYGYPLLGMNPFRHLVRVSARFKAPTTSGLLAFAYDSSDQVHGGMSGGIVVDKKTQRIVAVINQASEAMTLGVPIRSLVDFVSKVEPFVSVKTFPAINAINPMAVDVYPEFEPLRDVNAKFEPRHSGVLERRPKEADDVAMLREKAQRLADSMQNFIAIQSYSWGSGDKEPEANAEYEVRVTDGEQKFRWYPDGKKELKRIEFPRIDSWALGSDEWSELPQKVAKEYKLRIQKAQDTEIDGKKLMVFQYHADVEDEVCPFQPIEDFILFQLAKVVQVACYGEAWVDPEWNIVRISENLELSDRKKEYKGWYDYRIVVTYGQIKIGDEPARLAPLTTFVEGENRKRIFWCRGTFSNYRMFASRSRLLAGTEDDGQAKLRK